MGNENVTWLGFLLLAALTYCSPSEGSRRDGKLISTFQIVRFPNAVCFGSNSRNGTCYTSAECSDKGGTSSGLCADGFGVCCIFLITACGSSISENITYWTQPSPPVSYGTCGLTICPIHDDICSIRLDFKTFVISGPSSMTTVHVKRWIDRKAIALSDTVLEAMGSLYGTNCLLDAFYVQGNSLSSSPPYVCGTLSGSHMYVEADTENCNMLRFNLGDAANAVTFSNSRGLPTLDTRTWDITATQIECRSAARPPAGLTQYFYRGGMDTLYSYGHVSTLTNSVHLANQHQRICIKRSRGNGMLVENI